MKYVLEMLTNLFPCRKCCCEIYVFTVIGRGMLCHFSYNPVKLRLTAALFRLFGLGSLVVGFVDCSGRVVYVYVLGHVSVQTPGVFAQAWHSSAGLQDSHHLVTCRSCFQCQSPEETRPLPTKCGTDLSGSV